MRFGPALELFRWRERHSALAFEKLFKPSVLGAAFATEGARCDSIAQFATIAPSFEPIIPTDRAFNRYAGYL